MGAELLSELGFAHRQIAVKKNINLKDYKSIWISVEKQNIVNEIYGMIEFIEYSEDLSKYNPISEDKY